MSGLAQSIKPIQPGPSASASRLASGPASARSTHLGPVSVKATPVRRWIVSPAFDLLFVCGGLPLALIGLNVYLFGWNLPVNSGSVGGRVLIIAVLLGQHLFADAHNMATYFRIWGSGEDRERFRFYRTWLVYSCIPLFITGLVYPSFTGTMVYLYLIAVYWHYAAQVFGISLIYCYKRGFRLSPLERRLYKGLYYALAAAVVIRFIGFRQFSPTVWFGVPLPFWGPLPEVVYQIALGVLAVYVAIFTTIVVRHAIVERKIFPLTNFLMLATLAWLGLSLGPANALLWMYVPAFFHGTQYLAVCIGYQIREQALDSGIEQADLADIETARPAMGYLWTALITGTFFYVAVPLVLSQIGFDFAIVAGLVLAVINYHHFITDAAIWRLRDPRCRTILLG